jgi:phosphoglycolate phosphatase
MTATPPLELVCLDMAGTTVADDGAVLSAFDDAIDAAGVAEAERSAMRDYIVRTMGESKIAVFRALLREEDRAQHANAAFEDAYLRQIDRGAIKPIEGAEEVIRELRRSGFKAVLLTGFSSPTRDRLLTSLGWNGLADLTLVPSEAGRGRPYPDLVLTALLRTGAGDVAAVAVAGDTAYDMESGRRAGARVRAGVLTGTHDEATLQAAGATHVLRSVRDLPGVLGI